MIIGITGPSGAGKSYLGRRLSKTFPNSVYISCDQIMHNPFSNNNEKDFMLDFLCRKSLHKVNRLAAQIPNELLNLYWPFQIYSKFFSKKIEKLIKANKEKLIFIDSGLLTFMPQFLSKCDLKILVTADRHVRKMRVLARNRNTPNEIDSRDCSWSYLYDNQDFDIVIDTTNLKSPTLKKDYLNTIKTIGQMRFIQKCEHSLPNKF